LSTRTSPVATGRCLCEAVRYRLDALPLFTHACHCLDCQKQTGTAFAMTTIVLREDLVITHGETSPTRLSARSTAHGCGVCDTRIYVESTRFPGTVRLRPGTLDDASIATPQAHTWVKRKQPWLLLPADVPRFDENYDREQVWPAASLARLSAAQPRIGR
jgi:hypothetical protein